MSKFIEIKPEDLNESTFKLIGTDWMLVTAQKDDKVNTMTASWGGLGVLWNKNVSYVFIRPQRYTKEFVDNSDTFSLTFFDNSYHKQLGYLGTASGRDEDKIAKAGLTVKHLDGTPYFEEAKIIITCKKLYAQNLDPECFIVKELDQKCYPDRDYHMMYISEVTKVLVRD